MVTAAKKRDPNLGFSLVWLGLKLGLQGLLGYIKRYRRIPGSRVRPKRFRIRGVIADSFLEHIAGSA